MAEGTSTAFRYQDARGRGATRGRIQGAVERGRIMRLGRGVYATSTERIDQIAAAVLRLGGDAVASHETAAELWGIPILGRAPPSIQLPGIPA